MIRKYDIRPFQPVRLNVCGNRNAEQTRPLSRFHTQRRILDNDTLIFSNFQHPNGFQVRLRRRFPFIHIISSNHSVKCSREKPKKQLHDHSPVRTRHNPEKAFVFQ